MKCLYDKFQLRRVLSVMKNEGNEMAQSILKNNGEIVPRMSSAAHRRDSFRSGKE